MNIMGSELPPEMDLSPYGTPVHDLWGGISHIQAVRGSIHNNNMVHKTEVDLTRKTCFCFTEPYRN